MISNPLGNHDQSSLIEIRDPAFYCDINGMKDLVGSPAQTRDDGRSSSSRFMTLEEEHDDHAQDRNVKDCYKRVHLITKHLEALEADERGLLPELLNSLIDKSLNRDFRILDEWLVKQYHF